MARRRRKSRFLSKLGVLALVLSIGVVLFVRVASRPKPAFREPRQRAVANRSTQLGNRSAPSTVEATDASRSAPDPRSAPRPPEARRSTAEAVERATGAAREVGSSPHVALGVPFDTDASDDVLLDEREFVISYNPKRLDPNWVAWRLDARYLGHVRRKDDFRADTLLPPAVRRVTPHDYTRSGYDRGHMCPSADRDASEEMNSTTFLMTNMVPQVRELNAGPWEKLEAHERALAQTPSAELYIVAGGIFDADCPTIGTGIAVPKATYKIIVVLTAGQTARDVSTATDVIAVVIPNESGVGARAWTDFIVSVDDVEHRTGYDFLSKVPDPVEKVLEARVRTSR